MKNKVSGYIISYNRIDIVLTSIRSLWFVDELILIDKGSTDGTLEAAKKLVDKVISVPWSPVVEETRKFAESVCSHDWIVFLDDDECLSVDAIKAIELELQSPKSLVYKIPQRHFIAGFHSEEAYYWPESQIRFYRKGTIEFLDKVHGGYKLLTDDIFEFPFDSGICLFHFSHKSIWEWIDKANRYTSRINRLRMSDPGSGNDLILYSKRAIDRWTQKKNLIGRESKYEAMVAILRAIYDIVDRLKSWEEESGLSGEREFQKKCTALDAQYRDLFPPSSQRGFDAKIESFSATSSDINEAILDSKLPFVEELEIVRDELKKLTSLLEHEKDQVAHLVQTLELERTASRDEILNLENQLKSEKESFLNYEHAIHNSTSWKLTYPVRALSDLLSRLLKDIRLVLRKAFISTGRTVFYAFPANIDKKNIWICRLYETRWKTIFIGTPHYEAYRRSLLQDESHDFVPTSLNIKPISFDEIDKVINTLNFLPYQDPEVSIVIPTYGNLPITLACLRSIEKNMPKCNFEIVIIEDASGDQDISKLAAIKNIKYIVNEVNLGFTLSCNTATKFTTGKYLLFLNNDTEILPNSIDALLDVFNRFSDCGLVGSKLIYPTGHLQEAGGIVWSSGNAWNYGRMGDPNSHEFNYLKTVDYCSGASMMISRDLFEILGGFDGRYAPAYCEDTDLAFSVRKHGLNVYYQPLSEVIHLEGISHGTDVNQGIKSYQVINQEKFKAKWINELSFQVQKEDDVYWARDRSSGKKTVLFFDHHIPKFDQDAGSRTLLQIIEFLLEKGLHIIFYPLNQAFEDKYTSYFQQLGVEVIYTNKGKKYLESYLDGVHKYIDHIFVSRPTVAKELFSILEKYPKIHTFFYGHDIHFKRMELELALEGKFPNNLQTKNTKELEYECWKRFDVVFYPSDDEVAYVKSILDESDSLKKIRKLPILRFEEKSEDVLMSNQDKTHDLIFVGGFGHKPNLGGVIWFIEKVWPKILKKFPKQILHIVGSKMPSEVRSFASQNVVIHGQVSDEKLNSLYDMRMISIAPLLYGAGVKGKVVEALSHGVPVVTTAIGAQGLDSENSGLVIAQGDDEFSDAICEILDNPFRYYQLSILAIKYINNNFSIKAMENAFDGFLN